MSTFLPFSYKCPAWGNTVRITTMPDLSAAMAMSEIHCKEEDHITELKRLNRLQTPQRVKHDPIRGNPRMDSCN